MKPKLADLWIVLAVLFIAFLFWWVTLPSGRGEYVQITVGGTLYDRLPLDEDGTVDVDGKLTVTVKDGEVSVSGANCPDKLCEKHRPIVKAGQSIVCLPQRVQVTVTNKGADYDAVAR